MISRRGVSSTVIAALMLAYPCFSWYLPTAAVAALPLAAFLVMLIGFDYSRFNLMGLSLSWAWLLFASSLAASAAISLGGRQITSLVMIFYSIVLYLLASRDGWPEALFRALLFMTLIHAVATILFYFIPNAYDPLKSAFFADSRNAKGYVSGLTDHYSFNGDLLGMGTVLSACYLLFSPRAGSRKAFQWVLLLTFLFALVICTKRAHLTFSILAIVLVYVALSQSNSRWLKALVALCVGVTVLNMVAPYVPGIASALERFVESAEALSAEDLTSNRTYLWNHAIEGWLESPMFGNGWLTYRYYWPSGVVSVIAHNEILNLLYSVGLVGTAVFVLLAVHSVYTAYASLRDVLINGGADALGDRAVYPYVALFGVQLFLLMYGCTVGELLAKPITFVPYLMSVFAGYALQARVRGTLWKGRGGGRR